MPGIFKKHKNLLKMRRDGATMTKSYTNWNCGIGVYGEFFFNSHKIYISLNHPLKV